MSKQRVGGLLILALALALLSGCSNKDKGVIKGSDAAPGNLPPLASSYTVNGVDPRDTEYSGNLQVKPTGAGTYDLQWIITGNIQECSATVQGNRLLCRWHTIQGLELTSTGLTTYTITTESELYGTRTVDGIAKAGHEEAFPNPEP